MRTLAAGEDTKLDEPLFHYLKNTGMHPKLHPKLPCPCSYGVSDNLNHLDHVLCKTAGFMVFCLNIKTMYRDVMGLLVDQWQGTYLIAKALAQSQSDSTEPVQFREEPVRSVSLLCVCMS